MGGWIWKDRGMMLPNDDRRIPVFLEISTTDWCVCDAPPCLNMRSLTRSHSLLYAQVMMVLRSLDACQYVRCLEFLASFKVFAHSSSVTSVQRVLWADTNIDQDTVFFIERFSHVLFWLVNRCFLIDCMLIWTCKLYVWCNAIVVIYTIYWN